MRKLYSLLIVFLILSSIMINTSAESSVKTDEGESKTSYFEDIFTRAMKNSGIKSSLAGNS